MTDFVLPDETKCVRKMLDELLELESGLSDWEVNFIDSVCNWTGNFTQKQSETIVKIWGKLLGDKNTHS